MRRRGWNAQEACGEGAGEGDAEAAAVTLASVIMIRQIRNEGCSGVGSVLGGS